MRSKPSKSQLSSCALNACQGLGAGPVKALAFESLLPKDKAASLPDQDLDRPASTIGKDEERFVKWVEFKMFLHQRAKPVDVQPTVDRLDAHVNVGTLQ